MAAVAYIGSLHAHVWRQFVLRAKIERVAVAYAQRTRVDAGGERKQRCGVDILVARLENAGIAAVPVEGRADRIRTLESWGEAVRNAVEIRPFSMGSRRSRFAVRSSPHIRSFRNCRYHSWQRRARREFPAPDP